jgi:hypothetical protein
VVEAYLVQKCQGAEATPRIRLLRAYNKLSTGYLDAKGIAASECANAFATVERLMPQVKPKGVDDAVIEHMPINVYHSAAGCFAKAGDCQAAFDAYSRDERMKKLDCKVIRSNLGMVFKQCKQ